MPFFSVIIPLYNREDLIAQAIDSVLNQSLADLELIVIDDGSTDRGAEIVSAYGQRVKLLRQENKGPGAARNLGVKHASGQYIAFLDSDDMWFPWTAQTLRRIIDEQSQPSFLTISYYHFSQPDEIARLRWCEPRSQRFAHYLEAAKGGEFVGAGIAVIRRDELEKAGGLTDKKINAEDHDMSMRLGTAPGFVKVLEPPLVAVRLHGGNVSKDTVKTYLGICYLVDQEKAGKYPGGRQWSGVRREMIAMHSRPVAVGLLEQGDNAKAWDMFVRCLPWNIRRGRLKFVAGFLGKAVVSAVRVGKKKPVGAENH